MDFSYFHLDVIFYAVIKVVSRLLWVSVAAEEKQWSQIVTERKGRNPKDKTQDSGLKQSTAQILKGWLAVGADSHAEGGISNKPPQTRHQWQFFFFFPQSRKHSENQTENR